MFVSEFFLMISDYFHWDVHRWLYFVIFISFGLGCIVENETTRRKIIQKKEDG
ncbi:hypothetical protein L6270_04145 [Candidatus Parcubacteria bacterium]|nr:hypothetical protein [Patescibacteria group bacterium]MBU4309154.1 hypothetical protein [Patescibacteria group bacterium]MBU4432677.1 hypothetical protein [Patescibacteria group bacterium]MBU4577515.1 hypothetical protein [Patescibacteria group bacterium]MCG2697202.1 hypothetical protein [Candidatus Parcubacteria bacterium]